MNEIRRQYKSTADLVAFIAGGGSSLTVTYTLQFLGTGANANMFWNASTSAFSTGSVSNAMSAVSGNPGMYRAQFNHGLVPVPGYGDVFAVVVSEATRPYSDFFLLRFGDSLERKLNAVGDFLVPAYKTVSRVTDTHIRVNSYTGASGMLLLQQDITQDSTGAQPEETQTTTVPA